MIYLGLDDLLRIADRVIDAGVLVRDAGLLESAAARPRTTIVGRDAYEGLAAKAAALTHSLARNHALVDGNKRLALAALVVFLGINGARLMWSNEEAYLTIVALATGELDDVTELADRIAASITPR